MRQLMVLLLTTGLLIHASLWAQVGRANASGTITDPSAAVIAGAVVSIESEETGFRFSAPSNRVGTCLLPALPVGTFKVSLSKPRVSDEGVRQTIAHGRTWPDPQRHPGRECLG